MTLKSRVLGLGLGFRVQDEMTLKSRGPIPLYYEFLDGL